MLVKINETNLVTDLKDARVNGVWQDLLTIDPIRYDDDMPVISQADFDWWSQVISDYESDKMEIENFANLNNVELSIINNRIADDYNGEIESLHDVIQNVLCELRG